MNRKLINLLLVLASLSIAFVACNSNEDEGPDHAAAIAGTYSGNLMISEMPIPKDINVQRSSTNKVKIVLSNFSYGELNLGDIVADKIKVTEDGGKYTLEETTTSVAFPVPTGGSMSIPVKVSGTVSGGTLDLTISVVGGEIIGQNITVSFSGDKK